MAIGRGGKVLCYSTSACFWKTGHLIGQKVRFLEIFNKNKNHNFWLELKIILFFKKPSKPWFIKDYISTSV